MVSSNNWTPPSGGRAAVVGKLPEGDIERVRRYLPSNYEANWHLGAIWITGHDVAGWTLDGYVLPRLASGLVFADEVGGKDR